MLKLKMCYNLLIVKLTKLHVKCLSTISCKSVYISNSCDVYSNLALEDWFYHNLNFKNRQLLFLWRNSDCVVIGRHQNPWLEANLTLMYESETKLSRRNSGGGAVYHDFGNLNATFFTSRSCYNRKKNLSIIVKSLHNEWKVKVTINDKDDIVYNGYKISGTAAKLGSANAYHHCTVLVDSNKDIISNMLHKSNKGIMTNATASRPSEVINLREINNTINVHRLMTVIGLEYLQTNLEINSNCKEMCNLNQDGFHLVTPTEQFFPGISEKISELKSWKWIFGRTPKFKATKSYSLEQLGVPQSTSLINSIVEVEHGFIVNVTLDFPVSFIPFITNSIQEEIANSFMNHEFKEEIFEQLFSDIKLRLLSILNDERIRDLL